MLCGTLGYSSRPAGSACSACLCAGREQDQHAERPGLFFSFDILAKWASGRILA